MKKNVVILAIAMVAAACGGGESSDSATTDAGATPTTTADTPEATSAPTTQADNSDSPPAADAPGIVLTIGDQVWEFPGALCAFSNARAGEDGSEWNVSYVQDDLQVYVYVTPSLEEVTIDDIANGGDPTVQWAAERDAVALTVNGDDVVAEGIFTDKVGGEAPTPGRLEASCPGWFDAS